MNQQETNRIKIGTLVILSDRASEIKRIAEVMEITEDEYPIKLEYITNIPKKGPKRFGWQPTKASNAIIIGHKKDHPEYYL